MTTLDVPATQRVVITERQQTKVSAMHQVLLKMVTLILTWPRGYKGYWVNCRGMYPPSRPESAMFETAILRLELAMLHVTT